jgi:hypothetical protein
MNPAFPHCQRCGTNIPPEEAVPYVNKLGQPIPGQYRNWCLTHWAMRTGALPPSHPDFLKPRDPRTKRRDNYYLSQVVGHAALHGQSSISQHLRTLDPSPAPNPEKPVIPFKPSVSNILARASGLVSVFPEFEPLGAYLSKMSKEDLQEMWQDLEEKAHG